MAFLHSEEAGLLELPSKPLANVARVFAEQYFAPPAVTPSFFCVLSDVLHLVVTSAGFFSAEGAGICEDRFSDEGDFVCKDDAMFDSEVDSKDESNIAEETGLGTDE